MKKKKILVAMSGGVDSSVTAALLKEQGHEVGGATIRTWAPNSCEDLNTRACCGLSGVEDAREVADRLDIPYWVFNFEKNFKKFVVDYFASEYKKGRTPNPCISCNEHVKFRHFLARAKQLGYDTIATGHYAQLAYDEDRKTHYIKEAVDTWKDQSYVLFPLESELLAQLELPLGEYTKDEIRQKAKKLGLVSVMNKPDSQEICFIPSNDYGEFLEREYVPDEEKNKKGVIRMTTGEILGEHEGYYHYTRGQRRGLNVAYSERLYVVETIPESNEVIVGKKEDVFSKHFRVQNINWFLKPSEEKIRTAVKIRSQHQRAAAAIVLLDDNKADITFEEEQDAITPGQAAVIYDGPDVLGGGWIEEVYPPTKKTPDLLDV